MRLRAAALLVLVGACAAPPPAPFAPPALAPAFTHMWGSPLTGALPVVGDLPEEHEPDRVPLLVAHVAAVPDLPAEGLVRLVTRARMLVSAEGDRSLKGWSRLSEGALVGEGEVARRVLDDLVTGSLAAVDAGTHRSALLSGTTAALDLPAPLPDLALPALRVLVTRGDTLVVALAMSGEVEALDEDDPGPFARIELVVLEAPLALDGDPLLLAVPLDAPDHPHAALLIGLQARTPEPGDPDHAATVAIAASDARLASERRRASATRLTADESFLRQVLSAFAALRNETSRRSALVFLSEAAAAPLASDLALLASDELLAQLVTRVEEGGRDVSSLVAGGGGLAWLLERSALQVLGTRAGDAALPPDLSAVLLRHTGEAGRYPSALVESASECTSLPEMVTRLVSENRIALEDSSAAARVRAFDWLTVRGAAPAGFDPLAPLAERRAALAGAEAAAAAPVPAGGTTPP